MKPRHHFGGIELMHLPYYILKPYASPKRYYSPTRNHSIIPKKKKLKTPQNESSIA